MKRLGKASERASDVAGGWYSLKSTRPALRKGKNRKGGEEDACSHPREKLNTGLILPAIQPLIPSPSSPRLHSFSRSALFRCAIRSVQTNERPFFLSFPLIAESETRATVIPFLVLVSFFPSLIFLCLYFCLPLSLFSSQRVFVFFFSYWHRFHKYSIAGNVPRDCKTSGRFRFCRVHFAPLNWIWLKSMFH